MEERLVFIGPSYVGKGFISTYVANALKLSRQDLDFDLCFEQARSKDDVLECISHNLHNRQIVDIGGNTIFDFGKKEIEKLKEIVGKNAQFIYLRPSPDKKYSLKALLKQSNKQLKFVFGRPYEDKEFVNIVNDLNSPVYGQIATLTANTFQKQNGQYVAFPSLVSRSVYSKMLAKKAEGLVLTLAPNQKYDKEKTLTLTMLQRDKFYNVL